MELTPREAQILRLRDQGLLWKEIAAQLRVSPSTAKTHGLHARLKLGAVSIAVANWSLRTRGGKRAKLPQPTGRTRAVQPPPPV